MHGSRGIDGADLILERNGEISFIKRSSSLARSGSGH
jgi:hypothetical protein